MGNSCCMGFCDKYVVYPTTGKKLTAGKIKINSLVWMLRCKTTPEDLKTEEWNLNIVLASPPALKKVACITDFVPTETGKEIVLTPDQYVWVDNPYYPQALAMQNIMFGTQSMGSFPCKKSYLLPLGYKINIDNAIDFRMVPSVNPRYHDCMSSMISSLEKPHTVGTTIACVGDLGLPYLPNTTAFDTNFAYSYTGKSPESGNVWKPNQDLWKQCLNNPSSCSIFFRPTKTKPIDTETGKECDDLNSEHCTYHVCMSGKKGSTKWGCTSSGKCVETTLGYPTKEMCVNCLKNGTCGPGSNNDKVICCPESQKGEECKPPLAKLKEPATISLSAPTIVAIIGVLLVLVSFLFSRFRSKKSRFI